MPCIPEINLNVGLNTYVTAKLPESKRALNSQMKVNPRWASNTLHRSLQKIRQCSPQRHRNPCHLWQLRHSIRLLTVSLSDAKMSNALHQQLFKGDNKQFRYPLRKHRGHLKSLHPTVCPTLEASLAVLAMLHHRWSTKQSMLVGNRAMTHSDRQGR